MIVGEKKQRLKTAYLGNLIWLAARSGYKEFSAPMYSTYCKKLDDPAATDDRSGKEIIDGLVDLLKERKARRKFHRPNTDFS